MARFRPVAISLAKR